MSQFFIDTNASGLPSVDKIIPDTGTSPVVADASNNITIIGGSSSSFTESGIRTDGGLNTLTIEVTNRASGQVTTTNATPTTILIFPLGVVGAVYALEGFTTGRSTATGDGTACFFYSSFKTDGVTAVEIGTEYPTFFDDASLVTTNTTLSASAGNMILQVAGVAATTIHWDAILTFRRVL